MHIVECPPQARLMHIKRTRLFDGVQEASLTHLVATASLREYEAQEVFANEGDEASACFILIRGLAKITHRQSSGREHIIHIVSEGGTIGEACMFRQKLWPSTAVALEQSLVLRLERQTMHEVVQMDPAFSLCLLGLLSLRIRMCTKKLGNQGINASQRVSRYLMHRILLENTMTLHLKVSRLEMANMLGITRETLSRVLSRLISDGIIRLQGREMTLLDRERLQSQTEQD